MRNREEELIRINLKSTEERISLLEEYLAEAKENRNGFDPKLRNAIIGGYGLKIDELKKEAQGYTDRLSSK